MADGRNELFKTWLVEFLDEAKGRNNVNMVRNLSRALASIETCSKSLYTGQDALALKGIGPNIASKLDRKLAELTGVDELGPPVQDDQNYSLVAPGFGHTQKQTEGARSPGGPSERRSKALKPYVPALRSGGYAILLALFKAGKDALSKAQLVRAAQRYSSSSFTVPDRDRYFTAWNSMNTLTKHELVERWGSPPQYSLTEKGRLLAEKLWQSRPQDEFQLRPKTPPAASSSECPSPNTMLRPFCYSYLGVGDELVREQSLAITKASRRIKHYKICFPATQMSHMAITYGKVIGVRNHPTDGSNLRVGYLHSGYCTEYAPGLTVCSSSPATSMLLSTPTRSHTASSPLHSDARSTGCWRGVNRSSPNLSPLRTPQVLHTRKVHSVVANNRIARRPEAAVDYLGDTLVRAEELLTLKRREYDVVCLLDNREVVAQRERDHFQRLLAQEGVKVETQPLAVGDVLWIARPRGAAQKKMTSVVLDVVVERKRTDDLVSSIRDGRYAEQKLRLKNSGVDKVIYLVEGHGAADATVAAFGSSKIYKALMSTLLQHGFSVCRTQSAEETAKVIVYITRNLESRLGQRAIYVIPQSLCQRQLVKGSLRAFKTALQARHRNCAPLFLTLESFSEHNSKTRGFTSSDLFLRQLLALRGMTVPKANGMVDRFKTWSGLMHSLFEAEQRGINLLSVLRGSGHVAVTERDADSQLVREFVSLVGTSKPGLCQSWIESLNPRHLTDTLAVRILDLAWSLDYLLPFSKASQLANRSNFERNQSQSSVINEPLACSETPAGTISQSELLEKGFSSDSESPESLLQRPAKRLLTDIEYPNEQCDSSENHSLAISEDVNFGYSSS